MECRCPAAQEQAFGKRLKPPAGGPRLGVIFRDDLVVMLCDADIKLLEKRLCEKFSVIISNHISKDSVFQHLWRPLEKVTASQLENSAVLVSVSQSELDQVLQLACAAQATTPTMSFTFVARDGPTSDELFTGWHLAAEWSAPWLWVKNDAGYTSQKRLGKKFRA